MADSHHIENHLLALSQRMMTAAILKMVLSLYRSQKSSDLNEILCADADCASKVGYLTIY